MAFFPKNHYWLTVSHLFLALFILPHSAMAVEFNTDLLDTEDKSNIDFSRFAVEGYIMPGAYTLNVVVNGYAVKEIGVTFYEREEKKEGSDRSVVEVCLTENDISLLGLTPEALKKISYWRNNECADFSQLSGMWVKADLSETALLVSIPQSWLEYQDANWLPPSRWDDGIPGTIFDYNLNTSLIKYQRGNDTRNVSGTGTVGANYGPWRLRGDWQLNYSGYSGNQVPNTRSFDWSRIYAFRALRAWKARLSIGEDYVSSDLFDSWRYTGFALNSDDRMLPPRLRGFAPEVSGIARTNARVIISQLGRVIYETTVAAGPFRIQDLSEAVSGQLDVRVEEQDGGVQTFQVETSNVPFLTRPGQVRYKLSAGRPSTFEHRLEGPAFTTSELSWGLSNTWSLYGGGVIAGNYTSLALGVGRDLQALGTISVDVTQALARLPDEKNKQGKSWRLRYSKRFNELNSEIIMTGYRFSEREYISFGEYLDARYHGGIVNHNKEQYVLTANKYFTDARASINVSWSHQTYWDRDDNNRYSLSFNQYFDFRDWRNISVNTTAARSEYQGRRDDAIYLSLNVPVGKGSITYSSNLDTHQYQQSAGWYQRLDNGDNYRLQAGTRSGNGESFATQASGYYNHYGDRADVSTNLSWVENNYTSAGLTLSGGLTATAKGAALHPGGSRGGARMLMSTDGVSDIPVEKQQKTNAFGFAVIPDMSSYYRNTASINVNKLPDDIETSGSPVAEMSLTEGAIGYSHFDVLKGAKVVAVIRLRDGSYPPFGASVRDTRERELGIISDSGVTWLAGVNPEQTLSVVWGGKVQCQISLPPLIPANQLLLPCLSTDS